MSGIQPITYRKITDMVLGFILGYCKNINNTNNLPAEFKSGYIYDRRIDSGDTSGRTIRYTINNPISAIASSTIQSQFNSFLSSVGITNKLDSNITDDDFLSLVDDMVSFCCSKIRFAESPLNKTIIPVYIDGTILNTKAMIDTNSKIIYAQDVSHLLTILKNVVKHNSRYFSVKYTITSF